MKPWPYSSEVIVDTKTGIAYTVDSIYNDGGWYESNLLPAHVKDLRNTVRATQ